jgi:hypothetical protein
VRDCEGTRVEICPDISSDWCSEELPETPLGARRNAIAEANGWFSGNPSFGKSLLEYSEETRKGKRDSGTVAISVEELQKLRAEAAKAR